MFWPELFWLVVAVLIVVEVLGRRDTMMMLAAIATKPIPPSIIYRRQEATEWVEIGEISFSGISMLLTQMIVEAGTVTPRSGTGILIWIKVGKGTLSSVFHICVQVETAIL